MSSRVTKADQCVDVTQSNKNVAMDPVVANTKIDVSGDHGGNRNVHDVYCGPCALHVTECVRVCFCAPWDKTNTKLLKRFSLMTPGTTSQWKCVRGVSNVDEADYVVVVTAESEQSRRVPPRRKIYLQREPQYIQAKHPDPGYAAHLVYSNEYPHAATPWIERPFDACRALTFDTKPGDGACVPPRHGRVVCIVSAKGVTAGHRYRLEMLKKLCQMDDLDLHVYGRGLTQAQCNGRYRGEAPSCKFETLARYHYAVVMENGRQENYFTEKIYDCYLSLTMPIYWGCPNLHEHFESDAYIPLDTDTIVEATRHPPNAAQRSALMRAKHAVLHHYNVWEYVNKAVHQ